MRKVTSPKRAALLLALEHSEGKRRSAPRAPAAAPLATTALLPAAGGGKRGRREKELDYFDYLLERELNEEEEGDGDSPFCAGYKLPPPYGAIRDIAAQVLQDDAGLRDEVAKGTVTIRTLGRVVSEQLGVEQLHREDSGCAADSGGFDSDVPATRKEVQTLLKTPLLNVISCR